MVLTNPSTLFISIIFGLAFLLLIFLMGANGQRGRMSILSGQKVSLAEGRGCLGEDDVRD